VCGICGIVGPGAREQAEQVGAMCAAIAHRGPDGEGILPMDGCTLGHRRLSIIDLSGGSQPIGNETGSIQVVVNGEFYGFNAQREALEARGHRFSTHSDSENAVHLYEEHGVDFVQHLSGMFAVALWDSDRKRLVLARDRFGKKPLYWCVREGHLLFGSELGALLAHPWVEREPCYEAIDQYLGLTYVPPPLSGIANVFKLGPAERLVYEGGDPRIDRYWNLEYEPKRDISATDAVHELSDLLDDAVSTRMISDVPLGAFLSGGLDSSLIVALMARQSSRPVKTFSIGFTGGDRLDVDVARTVAAHLETEHVEFEVGPNALGVIPSLVAKHGEPFADPSSVPTYYVSKLAREHVTVALTGDGGDEIFEGYDRYRWMRQLGAVGRLGGPATGALGRIAATVEDRASGRISRLARRGRRVMEETTVPVDLRYARLMVHLGADQKRQAYDPAFARAHGFDASERYLTDIMARGPRGLSERLSHVDALTYLPGSVLAKVDIASMAVALEARAPLLDQAIAEFAARLPGSMKLKGPHGKWLLRQVATGLVPDQVLRRPKRGFGLPMATWLRGPLEPMIREMLTDGRLARRGIFTQEGLTNALEGYLSGAARDDLSFWTLLMLELWFRIVIDQEDLSGWEAAA
jgi:asparagine synthase (glutamine-hydrolysing)